MADKVVDIRQGKRAKRRPDTAQGRHQGNGQRRGKGSGTQSVGQAFQDYSLIFVILFLLAFGLVMLYSTSSYEAGIKYGDSAYYLKRQLFTTAVGLVVMAIASKVPYRSLMPWAWIIYVASLVLVIAVRFVGREVNGAKRWIYFGPISVQPAEISKIAVILVTALVIYRYSSNEIRGLKGMGRVLWPGVLQAACIYYFNKNMSTAVIVAAIAVGMYFVASRNYVLFFAAGGAVLAAAGAVVLYVQTHGADGLNFRFGRIEAWLDPAKYADGTGFQTIQALYGIGSGGIFGKGLGESMQKLGYIPEAQNDMIFSIICEELGLFGAVSIIILFVILCWRFMVVAINAKDLFGGLVASGVMIHIAVQVILNIAVVTNTIPNTGVTLPFISYGGSSVIILLAEVGMVINISGHQYRSAA